jgi:membrane associated rhomboid family serine protease
VLVFLWEMSLGERALQAAFLDLSVVPRNVSNDPLSVETFLDYLRSMFFHGGIEHIAGNMLYLWLFGDNIEDRFGGILYLVLYFVSGFVAAAVQVMTAPGSGIPLVGASGAIAGVLGAYALLFPGVKVRGIVGLGRFGAMQEWPAIVVLGLWFVLQLVSVASLPVNTQGEQGGVAFFAHIGGFIAGVVMAWIFTRIVPQPPVEERREMLYERVRR